MSNQHPGQAPDSRIEGSARWISKGELAELLGIPMRTITTKVANGVWPSHSQSRLIRFSPEDREYIRRRREEYRGDDPPQRRMSRIQILMEQAAAADDEKAARGEARRLP